MMFVDADTWCRKPLAITAEIEGAILLGRIGLVQDVVDGHSKNSADPWYLEPQERATYVNSGVILAALTSLPLFKAFAELSWRPQFLCGPYNDQKIINFALGRLFQDKVVLLPKSFNGMRQYYSAETVIGHCADGAGLLAAQGGRKEFHQRMCAAVLKSEGEQAVEFWQQFRVMPSAGNLPSQ